MVCPRPPGSRGSCRLIAALGLLLCIPWQVACAGLWERIQRFEHAQSWSHAVELAQSNRCEDALVSIERAQNSRTLTRRFAAESTLLKGHCLEQTGRAREARAHYRFIRDFLGDSRIAQSLPAEGMDETAWGSPSLERAPRVETTLPHARYSTEARVAGITGDVRVQYRVDASGRAEQIRVVNEAHPLLASWAIESVARGSFDVAEASSEPLEHVVIFRFLDRKQASAEVASRETSASGSSAVEP